MNKIVILHGWTTTTEKWNVFLSILETHHISYELLQIPGLTQETNRVWTMDDYVQWLETKIRKEKEKITILGHSNGGRIALAFAAKYQDKIQSLILIDSAGVYQNHFFIRMKRILFQNTAKIGKKFTQALFLRKVLYKV